MLRLSNFFYDRLLIPAFSLIYIPLTALILGVIFAYYEVTPVCNYALVCGALVIVALKACLTYRLTVICLLSLASFITGNLLLSIQTLSTNILERNLLDKTLAIEGTVLESWEIFEKTYKQTLLVQLTKPDYYRSHVIKLYSRDTLTCTPGSKIYCAATRACLTVSSENNSRSSLLRRARSTTLGTFFALKKVTCLNHHTRTVYDKLITLFSWLKSKRRNLLDTIQAKLSPYPASLYKTLFVGNLEDRFSENQHIKTTKEFSLCGIAHYLARSGIHVSIILIALYSFLQLVPCSFLLKKLLLLFILVLYALLSWTSLSFSRAFYYCLLRELCATLAIPFSALHTFGLISFLIVLYNPAYIFFLDFQLSFGATLMLILIHEVELLHKMFKISVKSVCFEKE